MASGTNTEILGKKSKFTETPKKTAGRPKVNRKVVIRQLKIKDQLGNQRYTNAQISRMMGCTPKTIGRIRKEAIESGEIVEEELGAKPVGIVEADFDSECMRAKGYSFRDWVHTRFDNPSTAQANFSFCSKVWENIFDSCSLTDLKNDDLPLGDQMATKFVLNFQEDKKRMRGRLKKIRFLFRFLGRGDVNDNHLTMSDAKHPRPVRRVPEISSINFGTLYQQCEDELVKVLGEESRLMLRLKIVSQMRTGNWEKEKELYGIQKGTKGETYLYMNSQDEFQFRVLAKKGEIWNVFWIPEKVRAALWEKYQTMEDGEQFMTISKTRLIKAWRKVTKKIVGRELILHDLRKISLTWLYTMGVPLDVAIMMNVGWKDANTATSNYLDVKTVLRKQKRIDYRENIPEWFKEGLDDFTSFEAVAPQ